MNIKAGGLEAISRNREYLESCDTFVLPVTEQLIYSYDYGDNWKVIISCEDVYHFEKNRRVERQERRGRRYF